MDNISIHKNSHAKVNHVMDLINSKIQPLMLRKNIKTMKISNNQRLSVKSPMFFLSILRTNFEKLQI